MRQTATVLAVNRHRAIYSFLFFLTFSLTFLALPAVSKGGGYIGQPESHTPNAYTWTPAPLINGNMLAEDSTWTRHAARGKAFADCPGLIRPSQAEYTPLPKRSTAKKKSSGKSAKAKPAVQALPPANDSRTLNPLPSGVVSPCTPMLIPTPSFSLCPDSPKAEQTMKSAK